MVHYNLLLTRILFFSCWVLMAYCLQPNCTSVADFDDCLGNTTHFCPRNIVCACKDGVPFCKCPNFRGQWGNYWYMGAKCEQLWNTLDLILVATLPGIGLALVVGVIIQISLYCKQRSKKNVDHHREERHTSGLQLHHNSACDFRTNICLPQPNQGQNLWSSSHQGTSFASNISLSPQQSRINYNFMVREPKEDNLYNSTSPNWDSPQKTEKHETNYGNKYSSSMHIKPFFELSTPGVLTSSNIQNGRQHAFPRYPTSEEPEMPYRIGRMQMKSNY